MKTREEQQKESERAAVTSAKAIFYLIVLACIIDAVLALYTFYLSML